MKNITIIIPARNEEASLKKLLKKFKLYKKFYNEIIVIDGQSSDKTVEIAKSNNCRVIKQKSLGYGAAIVKGVKATKTKYFIIFDSDGSKDPIYLDRFYKNVNTSSVIKDLIDISDPKSNEKTIFVWPEGILPNISQNDLIDYNRYYILHKLYKNME